MCVVGEGGLNAKIMLEIYCVTYNPICSKIKKYYITIISPCDCPENVYRKRTAAR